MKNKNFIKLLAKEIELIGGNLYYVGGYVRDKFILKRSFKKDIDLEIYGISFESIIEILKKLNCNFLLNEKFKTIKIDNIDISFPRKEVSIGEKHTDFSVTIDPFISPKEASYRRDFTMNTLMENVLTGEILDFYNGINDIKNKKIDLVSKEHFGEDPLRPLRAIEFSCRFGFDIDEKVINIGKTTNYKSISKERLKTILDKILVSEYVKTGIEKLRYFNFFSQIFPNLELKYNKNSLIWERTLNALYFGSTIKNKSSNQLYFMYTCLFYNLKDLSIIEKDIKNITNEKKLLCFLKELIEKYPLFKNIYYFDDFNFKYNMVNTKNLLDVLNLCVVDEEINPIGFDYKNVVKKINENSNNGFGNIVPLINGTDLIKLDIRNIKAYGDILNYAFELQLKNYSKKYILNLINLKFKNI